MKVLFLSPRAAGLGLAQRCAREGTKVVLWSHRYDSSQWRTDGNLVVAPSWRHHTDADLIILDDHTLPVGQHIVLRSLTNSPTIGVDPALALASGSRVEEFLYRTFGPADIAADAIEVTAVVGWRGWDFVPPGIAYLNETRAFHGGRGPLVPSAGAVGILFGRKTRLFEYLTKALEPSLSKSTFRGFLSVRLAIFGDEISAVAIQAPAPAILLEPIQELYQGKTSLMLHDLAVGALTKLGTGCDTYVAVLPVSVPPWPYAGTYDHGEETPKLEVTPEMLKHGNLHNATERGEALGGLAFCATAHGRSVREARNRVYRNVKLSCTHPLFYYRFDIGRVDVDQSVETLTPGGYSGRFLLLHNWGWL